MYSIEGISNQFYSTYMALEIFEWIHTYSNTNKSPWNNFLFLAKNKEFSKCNKWHFRLNHHQKTNFYLAQTLSRWLIIPNNDCTKVRCLHLPIILLNGFFFSCGLVFLCPDEVQHFNKSKTSTWNAMRDHTMKIFFCCLFCLYLLCWSSTARVSFFFYLLERKRIWILKQVHTSDESSALWSFGNWKKCSWFFTRLMIS